MKKLLVILLMVGAVFAYTRSESWKVYNDTLSGARAYTVPYQVSGLFVNAQAATVSVTLPNNTTNITVTPFRGIDFYPLALVGGSPVTLNAVGAVQFIFYNEKD